MGLGKVARLGARRAGGRGALLAMAGAGMALAGPVAAQSLDDRYWVVVSGYRPSIDTSASVSRPGAPGTDLDLETDLGLKKHETLPAVEVGARLGNRFVVGGEFFSLDRNGSRAIGRDIVFDGVTYAASASIDGKLRSDIYRVVLGYDFVRNDRFELGAAIGLHATDFSLRLEGDARVGGAGVQSDVRRRKFLAPLPTLGLYGAARPAKKVVVTGRVDYLSLDIGDYDGSILNAQAGIAYQVTRTLQVGAAYRYVSYDLGIDKERYSAKIDYDFSGPALFVRLGFR